MCVKVVAAETRQCSILGLCLCVVRVVFLPAIQSPMIIRNAPPLNGAVRTYPITLVRTKWFIKYFSPPEWTYIGLKPLHPLPTECSLCPRVAPPMLLSHIRQL